MEGIAEKLMAVGLSKNEVLVYVALIDGGVSTATGISRMTKLHRPNVYDALNRLAEQALVSRFVKDRKTFFTATEPSQLLQLMQSRQSELMSLISQLDARRITAASKSSSVEIFEGVAGIRKCLIDAVLSSRKEIFVLGVPREGPVMIGEGWLREWHADRIKRKITFHHLINSDYLTHRVEMLKSLPCTPLRFLPKEFGIPIATFIYDEGVFLSIFHPLPVAIRVLDMGVAASFKTYFKMLWGIASENPESTVFSRSAKR